MLKKFRPKGEYLYVGLFVISLTAISYNPIQQYIQKESTKVTVTTVKLNKDKTVIDDDASISIRQKINNSITLFGVSFNYKTP